MNKLLIILLLTSGVFPFQAWAENDMNKSAVKEAHLMFAKRTNSDAWKLLQKENLSEEEKTLLLYTVYSSAYHWKYAGTSLHMQRAEWLISRAYIKLNNGGEALAHAEKCQDLTSGQINGIKDFDFAYAHEAMARAYALIGDFENATIFHRKAKEAAKSIANQEDKKLFLSDFKSGNWNGFSE